jgi:ribonucleoside-diphosphate reductase alpha chain
MAKNRQRPSSWPKGKWSQQAKEVLAERYLRKDKKGRVIETPDEMCFRVAKTMASIEKNFGVGEKEIEKATRLFYEAFVRHDFLPNSPTLMNAGVGNDHLQYSACFVLPVDDSLESIFDAVKKAALIHKSGGGTGFSFSRLRPQGSIVHSTRGVASGPVSFMRVFDAATNEIKQGGRRRGANMGILRVDHPDILEFIVCKEEGGITNFNLSVAATDRFMKAVLEDKDYSLIDPHTGKRVGKQRARQVFGKIVEEAWKTGDPGLFFIDRANAGPANPVPSMGPIESTNPCLVGSTLVATDKGLLSIEQIVNQKKPVAVLVDRRVVGEKGFSYEVVNGFWEKGEKEIWQLTTKSGVEIKATADHQFFTSRGWIALSELKSGEDQVYLQAQEGSFPRSKRLPFKVKNEFRGNNGRVYKFNFPQEWSYELGLVLGLLVGDGWLRDDKDNGRVGFTFGEGNKSLMEEVAKIISHWYGKEIRPVKRENEVWHLSYHSVYLRDFFKKLGVGMAKAAKKEAPAAIFKAPREAVVGFLQGLFTADGTIACQKEKGNKYVRLTSKSLTLLKQVQLLLLNLGIFSQIYNRSRSPRRVFTYQNVNGEEKNYLADGVCFELNISRQSLVNFVEKIGFWDKIHADKVKEIKEYGVYKRDFQDEVLSVKDTGQKELVYDLSVPGVNAFFANGVLVHNCGEQPLYPNESCNLGSINLVNFLKKNDFDWEALREVVRLAVRFLDDVVEANPYPLEEVRQATLLNRRIGLGVMGWADALFSLEIPYESREAQKLAEKLMRFIHDEAHLESRNLAKARGPFPNFSKSIYKNGPALRNATLTTIAPTGSISIIAGASSGIEPAFALAFKHKANGRELTFVNPYFLAAAKKYHLSVKQVREVEEAGVLGEIKSLPPKLRKVFATAHEISPEGHIRMQAAFQKGVDNAVSKTVNLRHDASVEEVEKAYLLAYKLGCLGITIFRDGCRSEQVLYAGVGKEEEKKTVSLPLIKERPRKVVGVTYRVETPVGTAFITINANGDSQPLEVFVNVGKAGSDIAADAEAIGRLISLNLRIASSFSPQEVLAQVIDQLEGIGGSQSVGFGKKKVRSLADGIAQVLNEYLGKDGEVVEAVGEQTPLFAKSGKRDLCPSCGRASLIYEEGCHKCLYCGYSKC